MDTESVVAVAVAAVEVEESPCFQLALVEVAAEAGVAVEAVPVAQMRLLVIFQDIPVMDMEEVESVADLWWKTVQLAKMQMHYMQMEALIAGWGGQVEQEVLSVLRETTEFLK